MTAAGPGSEAQHGSGPSVRLLGAVRFVTAGGDFVELPSVSQRRLLAVLALAAGATLRPEYLSDLLDVSSGALRTTVSRLRGRLGEDTIRTDGVGYRVTCGVDTTRFTELMVAAPDAPDPLVAIDEALALWDGEALDEFRHEPWAEAEAARLDELRCVAVEDRAELLVGQRPRRRGRRRARRAHRGAPVARSRAASRSRPSRAMGARPRRCARSRTTGPC